MVDRMKVFGLLVLLSAHATAGGPANDAWIDRVMIPPASLAAGFSQSVTDVASATVSGTDPIIPCKNGDPAQRGNTLWYGLDLTGEPGTVRYLNIDAAGYDSTIAIFTGNEASGFRAVVGGCNDDGGSAFAAQLNGFRLEGGSAYSIMIARPSQNTNAATLSFTIADAPRFEATRFTDDGNGSCNGGCTLREAISLANATRAAVLLGAGTYTLSLGAANGENGNFSGDLDVLNGMGIHGAGAGVTNVRGIQPGGNRERVFDVEPGNVAQKGITVAFTGLTITDGSSVGPGGGINANGATNVAEHLALDRVRIAANASTVNTGGGVFSAGPTVIANSTIEQNTASSDGGGVALNGTVITRSDVLNSAIVGNTSNSDFAGGGGGIRAQGNLFVYNSTIEGNQARHSGGGILSTTTNGRVTLLNVTLSGNRADSNGNGGASGGGLRAEGLVGVLRNTVFSGNLIGSGTTVNDCAMSGSTAAAPGTSLLGNHLETPAVSTSCPVADPSNVAGSPAQLGALALNGGTTANRLPLPGSPVIDSGFEADCLGTDQRGRVRPQDGDGNTLAVCDKGAVELSPADIDPVFKDGFE